MATPAINLRVDEDTKARWTAAAEDAGYSLSEFIRAACDVAADDKPGPAVPSRSGSASRGSRAEAAAERGASGGADQDAEPEVKGGPRAGGSQGPAPVRKAGAASGSAATGGKRTYQPDFKRGKGQ